MVLDRSRIVPAKSGFETDDQAGEEDRFQTALSETRKQLTAVQERLRDEFGAKESQIFDAHLLVLEDPALMEEVGRQIRDEHHTPEYAFYTASEKYAEALSAVDDSYLSERAAD
ncbi:MAG: phosphoenolpyruvate-utilizing N-terminal domain-containing protein, partial [Verrucomicrobiota bacterium]|nr:phosphoenolpyruvate-utilizing N-terminal domain-containing protein [Verrucomicrobiota bacterium]